MMNLAHRRTILGGSTRSQRSPSTVSAPSKSSVHASGLGGPSSGQRRCAAAAAPPLAPPPTIPLPWDLGSSYSQGLREDMEDSLALQYDSSLQYLYCGVFDGHGGSTAAQWLAQELHAVVHKALETEGGGLPQGMQLAAAIENSFKEADQALMGHLELQGKEILSNAGSTATVLLVNPSRVVAANLGDSQAFLMRKNQALPLTTPHRVYGSGKEVRDETSRVKATGAWIHDGRVCNILAVSRAFGDWEFKGRGLQQLLSAGVERGYWPQDFADKQNITSDPVIVTPDISQTDLSMSTDEFLVIATDGLWDVMPASDVMRWVKNKLKNGQTAQEVSEGLVATALKRYSTDNISCIVVDFKGPEYWKTLESAGAAPSWLGALFGNKS